MVSVSVSQVLTIEGAGGRGLGVALVKLETKNIHYFNIFYELRYQKIYFFSLYQMFISCDHQQARREDYVEGREGGWRHACLNN